MKYVVPGTNVNQQRYDEAKRISPADDKQETTRNDLLRVGVSSR